MSKVTIYGITETSRSSMTVGDRDEYGIYIVKDSNGINLWGVDKTTKAWIEYDFSNKTLLIPKIQLTSNATGDIYYRDSGGNLARLPIGTSGKLLTVESGIPTWKSLEVEFIESITYSTLVSRIGSNGLISGKRYLINDYRTVHYFQDIDFVGNTKAILSSINNGDLEPIIVLAISTNKISSDVISINYPNDIIKYDWNPANYMTDVYLSDITHNNPATIIVTGFKGTILYRKDINKNIECSFDFRNVKNRRWKLNFTSSAWDLLTSYNKGDIVSQSNKLYYSRINANFKYDPSTSNLQWDEILDTSNDYIAWGTASGQGLPYCINNIQIDSTTYSDFLVVNPNNSENTIIINKKLSSISSHIPNLYIKSNIGVNCKNVTIECSNIIGTIFNNVLDGLKIDNGFLNSIITQNQTNNNFNKITNSIINSSQSTIINNSIVNTIFCNNFNNNIIRNAGSMPNTVIIGSNFENNTIQNIVDSYIGSNVSYNTIGNVNNCTIGNYSQNNIIENNVSYLTIPDKASTFTGFRNNHIKGDSVFSMVNFSSATHVFGAYHTTIQKKNSAGEPKLIFINSSDVLTVVSPSS